mgnify:CR=1 FL=1
MTELEITFVVAFLCSGALVTVYILWLAGVFSKRPEIVQQSVYTEMIKDAMILSKVEGWLEDEVLDYKEHACLLYTSPSPRDS